jgi:hypothetical protein
MARTSAEEFFLQRVLYSYFFNIFKRLWELNKYPCVDEATLKELAWDLYELESWHGNIVSRLFAWRFMR